MASGFERASRLSYILWGSSPDDELYRAELQACVDELEEHLDEKLKDPQTKKQIKITDATLFGDLQRIQEYLKTFTEGIAHPSTRGKAEDIVRAHSTRRGGAKLHASQIRGERGACSGGCNGVRTLSSDR